MNKFVVIIFYLGSTYLGNGVLTLNNWEDTFGLNGGWVLKTVTIDTTKDLLIQAHIVKLINFQVPVGFEDFFDYLT